MATRKVYKRYKDFDENDKMKIVMDKALHGRTMIDMVRDYGYSKVGIKRVIDENRDEILEMRDSSAVEIKQKVKEAFINQSVNFEVTIEKSLIKSTEEIEKRLEKADDLTAKDLIALHSKLFEQDRLNKEKTTGNEVNVFAWFKKNDFKPKQLADAIKQYDKSNNSEIKQLIEKPAGESDKGVQET